MDSFDYEVLSAAGSRELLAPLWARSTEWGELTPELIEHYGVNAPGGPASVVAARGQSGDLVGATFFVPVKVMICGRERLAHRPSAFLLDPSERLGMVHADPRRHPVMGMYFFAAEHFRAQADALLVTIPDPRWARVLKLIPGMQSTMFPLMSQPLPLETALPWNESYRAYPLTTFDSRIDELGSEVAKQYNCTIRRDAQRLEWKRNRGTMVVTAVERDGELVGVVASRKKGDRQWLICDILVADSGEAFKICIIAAARVADDRARAGNAAEPLHKVGVLATPRMMPVLEELGFQRDQYEFALAVHGLDPSVAADDIAPEHWYVTADD